MSCRYVFLQGSEDVYTLPGSLSGPVHVIFYPEVSWKLFCNIFFPIFHQAGPAVSETRDISSQHVSHSIHVWYIYLHLVDFYDKCR